MTRCGFRVAPDAGCVDRGMEMRIANRILEKAGGKKTRRSGAGRSDGFKGGKVVNEVLDKPTVMRLYGMINSRIISYVNGAVSAGKESVLFWAAGAGGRRDVALKIYLVSTASFKRRAPYITGDPRFGRIKKGTRNMVNLWAKKEFANLRLCFGRGLPVPEPIHVSGNVLAMEFVGEGGAPCPTLQESAGECGEADYREAVSIAGRLYREANLVHGDLSPYNMFKEAGGLRLFDMGSAVDARHPNAGPLLKRDIANITRFFEKRGVAVDDPGRVLEGVLAPP